MIEELNELLDKKLAISLRKVDDHTCSEIREQWSIFSPAPNCPTAGSVQETIKDICHTGFIKRREVAESVLREFLKNHGEALSVKLRELTKSTIRKHFPSDKYVGLIRQTESVYSRASGPKARATSRVVRHYSSIIECEAANQSRSAPNELFQILEDYDLRIRRTRKPVWQRATTLISKYLILPGIKWVFAILAAVIASVITGIVLGSG